MNHLKETIAALVIMISVPIFAQQTKLQFDANKKFKIVQFTDLHYVPKYDLLKSDAKHDSLVNASKKAIDNICTVLDIEKPNLVIITGDIVWGKPAKKALNDVLKPIIDRNIPFAITWGNHDSERDLTNSQLQKIVESTPGNVGIDDENVVGNSDFTLPIIGKDQRPAFVLYCFDSHSYSSLKQIKGYDWIKAEQIEAYRAKSKKYTKANNGKPVPALAFFHIALPEYNLAASDEKAPLIGIRGEKACAPEINTGLFSAMLECGGIMGVFVGHDHNDNYVTEYKGISLGYGQYTGGNTVYFDLPYGNGGRVFELKEGAKEFDTWIRLHTGEKIFPYHKTMK